MAAKINIATYSCIAEVNTAKVFSAAKIITLNSYIHKKSK